MFKPKYNIFLLSFHHKEKKLYVLFLTISKQKEDDLFYNNHQYNKKNVSKILTLEKKNQHLSFSIMKISPTCFILCVKM